MVSIIIPTKNRCDLLRETLASVVAQTYGNWEAIVVDDGSTDGTKEFVLSVAATESRVHFVPRARNPSGGAVCRNIGMSASKGEYVLFLDSDDLLAPECLERRVKVMDEKPALDFAVFLSQTFYTVAGDNPYLWNKFTKEEDLDRMIRSDAPWQTMGPLWRMTSLTRLGPWDERAASMQDTEFHIRAIALGLSYCRINEVDSFWRMVGPNSMTFYNTWASPRCLWNRVRLFGRIIDLLRSKNLLTKRRRRLLAVNYYEHAFVFNNRRSLAYKIWVLAWRKKIVGSFKFLVIIAMDLLCRIVTRSKKSIAMRLFPELALGKTYFTVPVPKKAIRE